MNNIKMPLATYVLYHSDFKDGKELFNRFYSLLCRDVEQPLSDGIDIPVYLRCGSEKIVIPEINFSISERAAIFILIDEEMYCCSAWRKYLDELLEIYTEKNENIKLYPISLYKYAFEINPKLNDIQFITLNKGTIDENWEILKSKILENLIRYLISPEEDKFEKIKLFISHAKKDGEDAALDFRNFLRADTKLDSFFDANDILEGHSFKKQLISGVKNSLLVILKSDIYSEREWCKIEVLTAKEYDIPTIIVNNIHNEVKRSFPYLGNNPIIKFDNNWLKVVNLILKTALNQYYQKILLGKINESYHSKNFGILATKPELYSFLKIGKNQNILYPEPPLGSEEIELLKTFNNEVAFYTPMQASAGKSTYIKNRNIAISISEAEDIYEYGCSEILLRDIILELSKHILIAGGKLLYGGDLRTDGFTKLFELVSYQYGSLEKSDITTIYFTNYFAWPIHLNLTKTIEADFKHNRVDIVKIDAPNECQNPQIFLPPTTAENSFIWAKSLTKMRLQMETSADARIFLGGKFSNFKGKYSGLLEEFLIAKGHKHPIYLLGGFGGVTNAIIQLIQENNIDKIKSKAYEGKGYAEFVDYFNSIEADKISYEEIASLKFSISDLNNGLTEDENLILFKSINIIEIIALVLKGLQNVFK